MAGTASYAVAVQRSRCMGLLRGLSRCHPSVGIAVGVRSSSTTNAGAGASGGEHPTAFPCLGSFLAVCYGPCSCRLPPRIRRVYWPAVLVAGTVTLGRVSSSWWVGLGVLCAVQLCPLVFVWRVG